MENNLIKIDIIKADPIELNVKCGEIYRNNLLGTYGCLCFYCGQTLDSGDCEETIFKHLDKHFNFGQPDEAEYLEDTYFEENEETKEQINVLPEFVDVENEEEEEEEEEADITTVIVETKLKTENHHLVQHHNEASTTTTHNISNETMETETENKENSEDPEESTNETTNTTLQTKPYCNLCEKQFSEIRNLRRHFKSQHSDLLPVDFNDPVYSVTTLITENNTESGAAGEKPRLKYLCNYCNKRYATKYGLTSHFKSYHPNESKRKLNKTDFTLVPFDESVAEEEVKSYQCNQCKQRFSKERYIKDHFKRYHPTLLAELSKTDYSVVPFDDDHVPLTKLYQCAHCENKYRNKKNLKRHFKDKHPERKPEDFNETDFSVVVDNNGTDITSTKEMFQCNQCKSTYSSLRNLKSHFRKKHAELVSKGYDFSIVHEQSENAKLIKYKCSICAVVCSSMNRFSAHRKIHSELCILQCTICDKLFPEYDRFVAHAEEEHPNAQLSQRMYLCTCCYKYMFKESYDRHMELFAKFKCDICSKEFNFEKGLILHKNIVHDPNARKHECDICHQKFKDKATLKIHIRRHTGEKPHECTHCKMRFIHRAQKVAHELRHTQDRRHQCELCGKSFYGAYYLSEHMKRHTNHKPKKCTYCDERFFNRKMQLVHERKHTGEKPYVCKECGASFRTYNGHAEHKALHTGVKAYGCRFCDVKFSSASGRRSHEKSQHQIV